MTRPERAVDVLVVGAGPAGLAAGAELAASGAGRGEVLEREREAGGVPRHCHHGGFGSRLTTTDGHFAGIGIHFAITAGSRFADIGGRLTGVGTTGIGTTGIGTSGPAYARRSVAAALAAGATVRTGIAVTGWAGPRTVETTGPAGLERITARAVVLATGARERPRSARLVPGSRPPGVYTTGELQRAVHLHGQHVGTRAVVIGGEPVGHAAVGTLRAAGVHVVAMVTDQPAAPLAALVRPPRGFPLLTGATVTALTGRARLSGVELRHLDGRTTTLRCDTVVFTGDFVPESELARRGGITLDPGTGGPAYDALYATCRPGVFAVGNLLHAVERAGVAAAEGRAVAGSVLRHLAGAGDRAAGPPVPLEVDAPLRWIAPNLAAPDGVRPLRGRFVLRTTRRLVRPRLVVSQDGRELHRQRLLSSAVPGRPFHLSARWLDRVDPRGSAVRITAP